MMADLKSFSENFSIFSQPCYQLIVFFLFVFQLLWVFVYLIFYYMGHIR